MGELVSSNVQHGLMQIYLSGPLEVALERMVFGDEREQEFSSNCEDKFAL